MSTYEDSRWDASETACAFCDKELGGVSLGVRICEDCARPEPTHKFKSDGDKRFPTCLTCGREFLDPVHRVEEGDGRNPDAA